MQLKFNMDVDEQVYIGDADLGMTGLLNLIQVTPRAAVASWTKNTKPDDIVADINIVLTDAWVSSGYALCPRKIGLAPEL
ncbi:major capsid family protein, partial [Xenorhabdus bovienii]